MCYIANSSIKCFQEIEMSHDNFAVMEVPLLNEAMEWVFAQIRVVQESTVYGVIRESLSIIIKAVDKVIICLFVKICIMKCLAVHLIILK